MRKEIEYKGFIIIIIVSIDVYADMNNPDNNKHTISITIHGHRQFRETKTVGNADVVNTINEFTLKAEEFAESILQKETIETTLLNMGFTK